MSTSITSRGGVIGLAGAILAGGLSAACFAVALMHAETMLIFLAYLAAIPLFIAGLGAGSVAGFIASLAGTAALFATQSVNIAVMYAILNAVPAAVLVVMALRYRVGPDQKPYWYPEGYLLTAITVYPCIIFLTIIAMTADQDGGLLGITTRFIGETSEAIKSQLNADQVAQLMPTFDNLTRAIPVIPAIVGCSWLFIAMLSIIVAQVVLQQKKLSLRAPFSLTTLYTPTWLIVAVALTGLAGALAPAPYNYIGTNLGIIMGVPFFFVGLAVVHAFAETQKHSTMILVAFYVLMIFPGFILLAALLGAVDQGAHFRQRFVRRIDKSV